MQLRTGNSGEQAQTGIHRHKAVIASPDNQGLGFDFTQTRAEIRELFRVGLQTLDKVFQVIATRQHVIQSCLKQRLGQVAGVEDKDLHHQLQVLDGRLTIQLIQALDTFGRHRGKQAHAARSAAH